MRYYYRPEHPKADANGFVEAGDLGTSDCERHAKDAPIMVDRFYENTSATDGTDIGSRRKHREYMKARGLTTASDYTNEWKESARAREKRMKGDFDHKERREAIDRAIHERLSRS